jgi:hypothetical protein
MTHEAGQLDATKKMTNEESIDMEMYNNTLCVSMSDLCGGEHPIIGAEALRKNVSRGRIEQVRRACFGNTALYAVESLPERLRAEVYKRNPDKMEKEVSHEYADWVEMDSQAVEFFADYLLEDGRHLTSDKQEEYVNNCSLLRSFGRMLTSGNSHRMRQSRRAINETDFWSKAAASLPRLSDHWPNSLPQSGRRLQAKYRDMMEQGYGAIVSRKFQNKNAARVLTEQQEAVMMQLIAHHNNLDNVMVADYYNRTAQLQGWPTITAGAVRVWRKKLDLVTAAGRRGATNFRNERTMQVKRSRPTAAFLMWTLDGWDCELLYQRVEDRRGHSLTTYCNRLTLEVVLDPCCNYPIGYAIGSHETPALIAEALRDAARHSRELTGEMLRSNQIQCDHYGIKSMTELYKIMGAKLTPARVKNAKAKVVEPYFGYLNKTYCKRFNNWSGFGVTTDPKNQPNSEALNLMRHSFPDEEGVRMQIAGIIAMERAKKKEEMMKMIAQMKPEHRLPLSKENYLMYFGATTGLTNAIEGCGLRPTLLGQKRNYDCFDLTFREHAGEKWTVKFDPEDLGEVLAVNEDGSRRYMLTEKYVQPMALAERKEGDMEALQAVRDYNKALEASVADRLAESFEKTEQLISDNPQLQNILGRLLIVDSEGQHKLPKAQKRLSATTEEDDFSIF